MSKQKHYMYKILFVGGYRPFSYRKASGPDAVSSPLIDKFALKLPEGIEMIVLSTQFKELAILCLDPLL